MTTILIILGIGAVFGVISAMAGKENPITGAVTGAMMAGSCLLQLLIPVVMLLIGIVLFRLIFG